MRTFRRCLGYGLVAYGGVLLLLMWFEESLIFVPAKYPDGDFHPAGLVFEDAQFAAADGTGLHGWYVAEPEPCAVLLFAHGNAGNLTHRADVVWTLHRRLAATVMIFDYRGYGRSAGSPNEAGILQDARAARAWLARRAAVDEAQIVLFGESIGGAVMVDLAAQDGARALILQSTFTSLPDVAAHHFPWAPVRLLMRTRLDSLDKIARYGGPLVQSHGDADEIVPYELGRRLHRAAPSSSKKFITIPGGFHNDPLPNWYYGELRRFLNQLDQSARR
ncbi:MAG: hypothetical protein A2W31_12725 [Planctomycetes bacterium RBG_16_64_10]|nr:MAG: hypothetical protein A2W31_12725 [Planctomycetes bacterium RBG_16_64_10]